MAEAEAMSTEDGGEGGENHSMAKTRKEKRKEMKKMKRKQLRKEAAERERQAEEARLDDPEEQKRIQMEEEEERKRREMALKEFQERERAWIEAMEIKRKAQEQEEEEEEKKRKDLMAEADGEQEEMDDDWEYVEEGPAEIIWQGNEIIVRKKKVRVPKRDANQKSKEEDADRPTSNPLPPQSEAFSEYLNASSAQQVLESVAKEVPNFGTEQDKAHCPFHLKTGACRFGQRCSRVHFYPDKSCTLLIRNMYNGPGIAWEQDEGLEYTDEEVEQFYEEFYEDVHTEFLKFGEIVNFKVCRNGSFHLRGNVYVHYKSLESAVLAYQSINGRYFAGKQVKCEFVNVSKWKVAICGEFMKSRLKACSHGTACNFIHCFRNPGGDYAWADWDKPPPIYWVKEMTALFGYSENAGVEKRIEQLDHSGQSRNSSRMVKSDAERHCSRRSKSKEMNHSVDDADRSPYKKDDIRESSHSQRGKNNDKRQTRRSDRWRASSKRDRSSERVDGTSSDEGYVNSERGKHNDRKQTKRSDRWRSSSKGDRSSERVNDTSSVEGYANSERGKHNDRKQTRRSDRWRPSSKGDRSSERLKDTSSDEGYMNSERGKHDERKQTKSSDRWRASLKGDRSIERVKDTSSDEEYANSEGGKHNTRGRRSDRWRGSLKRSRSSEGVKDTSSDEGYENIERGRHNDRKQTKRSDRRRASLKWDLTGESLSDTSSDEGRSDSLRGKHNDKKKTKYLDGRSKRWSTSVKQDEKERIHYTSSDGGYPERDIDGTRDTNKIRHHKHTERERKHESFE